MISSNHRRFRTEVHESPPSPKRFPFESRWQPPASITIPILIGNFDESADRAPSPLPKTNGMDIHKKISLIDEVTSHHDKFNNAIIIGASTTDDSSVYTANFTEIMNKADKITKDAENILKLLEDDMDSSVTSFLDSYYQDVHSWRQESLDYELEDVANFSSDDPSMSSGIIQSQAFELLDMLYGRDSFRLAQNHAARRRNTSSRDAPVEGNEGDQLVSTRQLTALFATESSFVEEIDPSRPQNSPQRKNTSSSPRDLVLSRQEHVRNESRNVFGSRGNGHDSPRRRRQANTRSRTMSTCSANNLCRQAVPNKPPRFRDLVIRSRSCEIDVDSSDILDISPLTHHPRNLESAKAHSSPFRRTHSEGTGNKPKVVPPPPPHPKGMPLLYL
ncbi:hypothetical protein HJC23_001363 [Cyclotella cryptica]|uniref:Uncharacterized protein n=1 Tax=Cyclotella cryptica TaxID=29204 RepID=A0ABD3PTR7_9STRA|eukprot:CCRYP_013155-RA/>CCRYP_013155-RA protein AED:0.31 eAED:0.31 QI:0/-1/0/1/-1/1/1/0/388